MANFLQLLLIDAVSRVLLEQREPFVFLDLNGLQLRQVKMNARPVRLRNVLVLGGSKDRCCIKINDEGAASALSSPRSLSVGNEPSDSRRDSEEPSIKRASMSFGGFATRCSYRFALRP